MSSDLREALDKILSICNHSRTYTRRVQTIHEVAMKALGLTASQREARHIAIFERTGADPEKQRFLAREAKRKAREAERNAEQLERSGP